MTISAASCGFWIVVGRSLLVEQYGQHVLLDEFALYSCWLLLQSNLAWIAEQDDGPSRAEAIRRLVEIG
jgi:hypothetical protein